MAGQHAVGERTGGAAARVRPDGDVERRHPGRRGGGRAGVGERRSRHLHGVLGHPARAAHRRAGVRAGPALLGRQRADDAVLPGRGPGGAPRVRPRRPAGTAAVPPAARGGHRRHGGAGRHLPARQPGQAERPRLGRGDVDGHRPGPGPAGDPGPPRARQGSPVRTDDLRRRRPGRAARHRDRLQQAHRLGAARHRRGGLRAPRPGDGPADAQPRGLRLLRRDRLVGVGGERGRPRRRGPGHRAGRSGLHPEPRRAGARHRARAALPRAADPGAGAPCHRQPDLDALAEHPAAELLPSVDELPHRSALRPGQRRCRAESRDPGDGVRQPGDPRHPAGLRGRQAGGRRG